MLLRMTAILSAAEVARRNDNSDGGARYGVVAQPCPFLRLSHRTSGEDQKKIGGPLADRLAYVSVLNRHARPGGTRLGALDRREQCPQNCIAFPIRSSEEAPRRSWAGT